MFHLKCAQQKQPSIAQKLTEKPPEHKVPASSIAKNVAAAKLEGSRACGVASAGRMSSQNATRDVDRLLNRFGMAWKVPRDMFTFQAPDHKDVLEVPYIRPSCWVEFLLKRHPVLLCGVDGNIESQLEAFWRCFQHIQPGHSVFQDPSKLKCTLPLALHGDEGRYLKRSNYMICTVESLLGSTARASKPCTCCEDPVLSRYGDLEVALEPDLAAAVRIAEKQHTNTKGHSYLSRFLCFGMASKQYKDFPGILDRAFDLIARDFCDLCQVGVLLPGGRRFFGAFLGMKGDLKFHHQVGHLSRSYFNLGPRTLRGICHLCSAGMEGYEFESLDDEASWLQTMYEEPPWKDGPPSLASIPFDPMCVGAMFKLDMFHLWKCGQGRDVCGSTLVVLARLGKFDFEENTPQNLEARLTRAHSCFRLWCEASGNTPALRSFTQNNVNCQDQSKYPWFNCKGSDCMLITRWLLFFLTVQLKIAPGDPTKLLKAMKQTLDSSVVFFQVLYNHKLWLRRACAQRLQHHLLRMLRGFKVCAAECIRIQVRGFGLKPKLLGLMHLVKDLQTQIRTGAPLVLSPLAFNCEMNEDAVGLISRLARRVSARTVNTRVFDRIMFKSKALVRKKFAKRAQRGIPLDSWRRACIARV